MHFYECKALNKDGDVIGKKIFANENSDLFEIFKKSELILISKAECRSSIKNPVPDFTLPFFKNLMQLTKNRLNLIESLKIIKTLFRNDEAQLIIETITEQIKSGKNLSMALLEFPRYFNKLTIKTIEISEKTAELPESLEKIVEHLEALQNLKNKIKESVRYPIILFGFISFVFLFWIFILVPKFAELFYEINIQPPLVSRLVIRFSKFVSENILFVVSGVGILSYVFWKKVNANKSIISKVPIISKMKREIQVFNFFTAMETMLHDKVNLLEALECMSDIIPQIPDVIESIRSGNTLTSAIGKSEILNDYELSIIKAGEQSGDLWPAFRAASDIARKNIENMSQRIISTMQPIAITFMGILLIVIVYALISPLYSNLNFAG